MALRGGQQQQPAAASHLDALAACWQHPVSMLVHVKGSAMCLVVCAVEGGSLLAGAVPRPVSLTASDWDECSVWLTALKRLLKARQMLR